jgi:hypothetical protein
VNRATAMPSPITAWLGRKRFSAMATGD